MDACGPGCGYCGRCTAPWEDEPDDEPIEDAPTVCIYCSQTAITDDDNAPYCSPRCAAQAQGE